jgi:hypothetical protein
MDANGLLNHYVLDLRPAADRPDRQGVDAFRVEGWREDYAFFQNPHDLREATLLVPREIVAMVRKVGATPAERYIYVQYQSIDGKIGGREGPYLAEEQAEARGAELGTQGMTWNLVRDVA